MTSVGPAATPGRIRVGIVLDEGPVEEWQAAVLSQLERAGAAELRLVVVTAGSRRRGRWGHRGLALHAVPAATVGSAALRLFAAYASRPRALRTAASTQWWGDVPVLQAPPRSTGQAGLALGDSDVDRIREQRLDLLLWLGSGRPAGTVLGAARHGVWALHFGDLGRPGGGPPGFWEIVDGHAVVEAALVRLVAPGGDPVILREGWFAVAADSYARTQDRLLLGPAGWPAQVCRQLLAGATEPEQLPTPPAAAPRGPVSLGSFVRFLRVASGARLRTYWHHGLRHDDWNVGIVDAPVESFLAGAPMPRVAWAPVARGHYAADPFGRWADGALDVLYEDYAHASGEASIARRRWIRDGGWQPARTALDIGSHLSYPFLVEHEGRYLLLPESRASGKLVLYESATLDGPWRPLATLDPGEDVADATLLRHGDLWWLLAMRSERLNPATELAIWYSERPEGPWQAHPLNPVVVDVRSARPAGPCFIANGQLYRPAQDCSTGYGDRVTIKRIVTLTTERFREEAVAVVQPERDGPFPYGVHTLTGAGPVTLVDGKRRVWSTAALSRVIRRRIPR